MDTSYLKLLSGARITNHMGLRMDPGFEFTHGKNYLYIDIPARLPAEEVKRNQHVFLEAAGTVDVKGRQFVQIEPNPALAEYGQVQSGYMLHPDSGVTRLGVWFTAHKALDMRDLAYLIRIYMPA